MHARIATLSNILHQWCPLNEREVALLRKVRGCRTRSASKMYDDFPVEIALAQGLACEALYHKKGSPYRHNPELILEAITSFADGKAFKYACHLIDQLKATGYDAERVNDISTWLEDCKYRSEQDELNQ